MRKLVYYIGATLDGYIAGPGGEIDFFPLSEEMLAWIGSSFPETIPTHLREHVGLGSATNRAFDTVVMGRATYEPVTDVEAMEAFRLLCRTEGIIPALESAHALAYALKALPSMKRDGILLVNLSGRGDKDLDSVLPLLGIE